MSDNLSNGGRSGTFNLGDPIFLEGTNTITIKSTVATNYTIDGLTYTKAITDNIAMTALAVQADLTTCLYLIQANASGTILLTKGVEVLTADFANDAVQEWPVLTEDYAPLAVMQIATSGVTYTCGTDDLATSGLTDIFAPLFSIPARPLTAALT